MANLKSFKPNWSWAVLFGSFSAFFIADGWSYTFGMLYPELITEFGESRGATAYVPTLLYGIPMILSPLACSAVDKVGCKILGIFGGIVFCLSLVVASVSNSLWAVCLSIGVLTSVGLVAVYVSAYVAVTYWFDDGSRGLATGIAVAGSGLGSVVFPHLIDWLMTIYMWRGTVLIVGGIALNAALSGFLYRPFPVFDKIIAVPINEPNDSDLVGGSDAETKPKKDTDKKIILAKETPLQIIFDILQGSRPDCTLLRTKVFCFYCFINLNVYLWVSIPYLYIYDLAVEAAKLDHDKSAWLLSVVGISRTVGQIAIGLAGDKKGISPNFLMGFCTVVTGIATFLVPFSNHYVLLIVCCATFGFSVSATYVLPMICMGEIIGMDRAVAGLGLLQFVQGVATLFGTPVGGWIRDARGSYDLAFIVSGVLMAIGGLLFCFIPWLLRLQSCKSSASDVSACCRRSRSVQSPESVDV